MIVVLVNCNRQLAGACLSFDVTGTKLADDKAVVLVLGTGELSEACTNCIECYTAAADLAGVEGDNIRADFVGCLPLELLGTGRKCDIDSVAERNTRLGIDIAATAIIANSAGDSIAYNILEGDGMTSAKRVGDDNIFAVCTEAVIIAVVLNFESGSIEDIFAGVEVGDGDVGSLPEP